MLIQILYNKNYLWYIMYWQNLFTLKIKAFSYHLCNRLLVLCIKLVKLFS